MQIDSSGPQAITQRRVPTSFVVTLMGLLGLIVISYINVMIVPVHRKVLMLRTVWLCSPGPSPRKADACDPQCS